MRVRGSAERGTPDDLGVRGGPEKTMGGDLGRQGFLRKSNEIFEGPGEGGGGGRRTVNCGRVDETSGKKLWGWGGGGVGGEEQGERGGWGTRGSENVPSYIVEGAGMAQRQDNPAESPLGDACPRHIPEYEYE